MVRDTDLVALMFDPELLRLMLTACPDAVVATNRDGQIMLYTGASEGMFGFAPVDVMNHDFGVLLATPEARTALAEALAEHGKVVNLELPGLRKGGGEFAATFSAAFMKDRYGDDLGAIFYIRDHSGVRAIEDALRSNNAQLKQMLHTLDHVARHDQLTGMLHRGSAIEAAEEAILTSPRDDVAFGVVLFDLDHFKSVNDSYGHLIGDQVLAQLAGVIKRTARQGDIVGRFGGEEFIAFLPYAPIDQVRAFAERVRAAIELAHVEVGEGVTVHVTISAGVATVPSCADSLNEAIRVADDRLYAAKHAGRNRVVSDDLALGRSAA